jgi:hypothetical protein
MEIYYNDRLRPHEKVVYVQFLCLDALLGDTVVSNAALWLQPLKIKA